MTDAHPYSDGNALWSAISAYAKAESVKTGIAQTALIRRFVIDRFLDRVFRLPGDEWVLKGGNAMLTRVNNARTTKDIDLLAELQDLNVALEKLRLALAVDIGDHFRFVVTRIDSSTGGALQPNVEGYRLSIDAYCGVKVRERFSIDLVTGSLMTVDPEVEIRTSLIPAIPSTQVRLYPVVDHIADKLCATQSTYGSDQNRPSSRVRDLVDLVVFARTQFIDEAELSRAIKAEWLNRRLPGLPHFRPPDSWRSMYPRAAKGVAACGDVTSFDRAVDLVSSLLSPIFDRTAIGQRWNPRNAAWQPYLSPSRGN